MTPIKVSKESLGNGTEWSVSGQSPANSPAATLASLQQLFGVATDPVAGPLSGIQIYELVAAMIVLMPGGSNLKGIQATKDELKRRIGDQSGAGSPAGMALPAGGGALPPGLAGGAGGGGEVPAQLSGGPPPSDF